MEEDSFLTIEAPAEGFYKEKGSKFLAFAFPAENEEEVKLRLDALKQTYHDARHHCFAFVLGKDGENYRANDDGEPGNSAGTPILGQIRSKGVTNTLVVVVRYFGGTKLGVGGLVTAYKTAAADALAKAKAVRKYLEGRLAFTYGYEDTNEVMRLVQAYGPQLIGQEFTAICRMEVAIRLRDYSAFREKMGKIPSVQWW